jgi:hypothetical protein
MYRRWRGLGLYRRWYGAYTGGGGKESPCLFCIERKIGQDKDVQGNIEIVRGFAEAGASLHRKDMKVVLRQHAKCRLCPYAKEGNKSCKGDTQTEGSVPTPGSCV